MRPRIRKFALWTMSLFSIPFLTGCTSLTPYPAAVARIPADRLMKIGDQQVHVEQSGHGEPILLLHGFAASTYSYRRLAPLLADHYRVIAIDLNGFGYTERPDDAEAYSTDGQLQMIKGVMDALQVEQTTVVGHSYGATIAMLLATKHPERVRDLVLISPPPKFEQTPWYFNLAPGRAVAYGMVRGLLSNPGQFRKTLTNAFYQESMLSPEDAEAYRERLLVKGLSSAFKGFSASFIRGDGSELDPNRVSQPTLVIAGRHDTIVSLQHCQEMADAIPEGHLVIMENSGHSAPEEEPDAVYAAIQEALSRTEK